VVPPPKWDGCGSVAFVALVHLPVVFVVVKQYFIIGLAKKFNKSNGHNRWDFSGAYAQLISFHLGLCM